MNISSIILMVVAPVMYNVKIGAKFVKKSIIFYRLISYEKKGRKLIEILESGSVRCYTICFTVLRDYRAIFLFTGVCYI